MSHEHDDADARHAEFRRDSAMAMVVISAGVVLLVAAMMAEAAGVFQA